MTLSQPSVAQEVSYSLLGLYCCLELASSGAAGPEGGGRTLLGTHHLESKALVTISLLMICHLLFTDVNVSVFRFFLSNRRPCINPLPTVGIESAGGCSVFRRLPRLKKKQMSLSMYKTRMSMKIISEDSHVGLL